MPYVLGNNIFDQAEQYVVTLSDCLQLALHMKYKVPCGFGNTELDQPEHHRIPINLPFNAKIIIN